MSINKYSYQWYLRQFAEAKDTAEKFILSVDEARFMQPPAEGKWSIAECYSHLINYGDLYFDNLAHSISTSEMTTDDINQSFVPRWVVRKLIAWFEPPYKIKLKTVPSMQPDEVVDYNRMELLDAYINLQDRFIAELEKGRHQHLHLGRTKMKHPLVSFIRMALTETFALAEVHQRRHQWQAEQTLAALNH